MMQLRSIEMRNVRAFVEPIRLDELGAGLNLITGPNGAGKSTIVRALRAAFFTFHRSSVAKDLLPWREPGSSPQVTVEFQLDNGNYRLTKRFLKGAFAELQTPGTRLEGEQAESELARLFGFESTTRGESKQLGVPGLLWVEQGAEPDLLKPVQGAGDFLRDSLASMVGEVASSDGDELLQQLESELYALRVRGREQGQGTKSAKGELAEAQEKKVGSALEMQRLESEIETYRQRVDELGRLKAASLIDRRDRPWEIHEQSAARTKRELVKLDALRDRQKQARTDLARLQSDEKLLESRIRQRRQLREAIVRRRQALEAARQALAEQTETHTAAGRRQATARQAYEKATATLEQTDLAVQLVEQRKRLSQSDEQRAELTRRVQAASQAHELLLQLTREIAGIKLSRADVDELRRLEQEVTLHTERARLMATQLEFDLLEGQSVSVGSELVTGSGKRSIDTPTSIHIEGIGSLMVRPGGSELQAGLSALKDAKNGLASRLASLGQKSVSSAFAAFESLRGKQEQLQLSRARLHDLAPEGMEQLELKVVELDAEIQRLQRDLERLGSATTHSAEQGPLVSLEQARANQESARIQIEQATATERAAASALALARSAFQHAESECRDAEQAEPDLMPPDASAPSELPETDADRQLTEQLSALQAEMQKSREQIETFGAALAQAMPDNLELDLKRYTDSASMMREQARQRELDETRLTAELSQAGAGGLEEQYQRVRADHQRWLRREEALNLRADALAWLVQRIRQRRSEFTARLQAPLQQRMDHYLRLLMPGARLNLDAALMPVSLSTGSETREQPVPDQSFGTREQLVLLARLAYADLLAQAGRPTLIILDDGLLHADNERLEHMKRMLYDASQRHQILLFSCHPERWSGLGVAARSMPVAALAGSGATGA